MGHEAQHVARAIGDARDVTRRAVGIARRGCPPLRVAVGEEHLPVCEQGVERLFVGDVVAFAMGDGQVQDLARLEAVREARVGILDPDGHRLTAKMEAVIADQHAWQQAGLAQDLEAVADADDRPPRRGRLLHRRHDGREAGDGSGAEIVAVGKTAGQDDRVRAVQRGLLVPDIIDLLAEDVFQDMKGVLVAIGSGETDDSPAHRYFFPAGVGASASCRVST